MTIAKLVLWIHLTITIAWWLMIGYLLTTSDEVNTSHYVAVAVIVVFFGIMLKINKNE